MVELVTDDDVIEKALKRAKFVCQSCGLTPLQAFLQVIWTKPAASIGQRQLKDALVLCLDCCEEPVANRVSPSNPTPKLTHGQIADRLYQREQFDLLELQREAAETLHAKTLLKGLDQSYSWDEKQIKGTKSFINDLGEKSVRSAVGITVSKCSSDLAGERFNYFAKICWNWKNGT